MLNLLCDDLPNTIEMNDKAYRLYTDFRDWIELYELLLQSKDYKELLVCICDLFIEEIPDDIEGAFQKIIEFLKGNTYEHKRETNTASGTIVFSYVIDAPYIIGAFQECYGIDLCEIEYMHWWKFNALFDALNESCELKQRIYYRSIDLHQVPKEQRVHVSRIKAKIALPSVSTTDEYIASVFI